MTRTHRHPVAGKLRGPGRGLLVLFSFCLAGSAVAQVNDQYFHDQPIVYRDGDETRTIWPGTRALFADQRIRLRDGDKTVRIVRRQPTMDGAINIEGGSYQDWGSDIQVTLDIPTGLVLSPYESFDETNRQKRHLDLAVVALGNHMRGGAIVPEANLANVRLEPGQVRFSFSEIPFLNELAPGAYELRLQSDGFVLDYERLTVVVRRLPGTLKRVVNPAPGRETIVEVSIDDAPPLPDEYNYALDFVFAGENTGYERMLPDALNFVSPGQNIALGAADRAGTYLVDLFVGNMMSGRRYLIDSLEVRVDAGVLQQSTGGMHFTLAGVPVYAGAFDEILVSEGEAAPIELRMDADNPQFAQLTMQATITRMSDGQVIQSWNVRAGEAYAWSLPEDLPRGEYQIGLGASMPFGGGSMPMFMRPFRVMASDTVELIFNGSDRVQFGERINVSARFESMPDREPYLMVYRLGGHVPGCAIESAREINRYYPTNRQDDSMEFEVFTREPGNYLLWLMQSSGLGNQKILDSMGLEVVGDPMPGSLKLSGPAEYVPGAALSVIVDLPDWAEVAGDTSYRVELVRLGGVAVGGAPIHSSAGYGQPSVPQGGGTVNLNAPRDQGVYDLRLMRCNYTCAVVDVATIRVRDPESPYPLNFGLTHVGLRNDLTVANNSWPPYGEFLTGGNCRPFERASESMELRFVTWRDGQFVPKDGPIEYGEAVFLEGRFNAPALKNVYTATVDLGTGERRQIQLVRDPEEPAVARSELVYVYWDNAEVPDDE